MLSEELKARPSPVLLWKVLSVTVNPLTLWDAVRKPVPPLLENDEFWMTTSVSVLAAGATFDTRPCPVLPVAVTLSNVK